MARKHQQRRRRLCDKLTRWLGKRNGQRRRRLERVNLYCFDRPLNADRWPIIVRARTGARKRYWRRGGD